MATVDPQVRLRSAIAGPPHPFDRALMPSSSDRAAPIKLPRTRKQAEEDLTRIDAWDNGNQNIWSVSLAPWLDAPKPL